MENESIRFERALAKITGTRETSWEGVEGPESGCGVDFYFEHRRSKSEAYINQDQDHITITIDGETVFSGLENTLPQ